MARSRDGITKGTKSLKSNTPVPLAHDGPLSSSQNADQSSSSSLQAAQNLLCRARLEESNESVCLSLLKLLKNASTNKEQLQALGGFRNQWKQQQENNFEMEEVFSGLYRILLEWAWSEGMIAPLRRAIYSTLADLELREAETLTLVQRQVIETLWSQSNPWKKVLGTIEVAMNYSPTLSLIQQEHSSELLVYLYETHIQQMSAELQGTGSESVVDETFVSDGLHIAEILKLLLSINSPVGGDLAHMSDIQEFLMQMLKIPTLPTDGFNILGISHARVCLTQSQNAITTVRRAFLEYGCNDSEESMSELSQLTRLTILQGYAATLSVEDLQSKTTTEDEPIMVVAWRYFLSMCETASDPLVRLGAVKGLSSLLRRIKSDKDDYQKAASAVSVDPAIIQATMQSVMTNWENPPMRKIGTAIPSLFEALLDWFPEDQLSNLKEDLMNQPVNRKGRYLALETLLTKFGAKSLDAASLLPSVGDRGHNAGVIADLWVKILITFWKEIEAQEDAWELWISSWVPSMAENLRDCIISRRRQISSFCIPRLITAMKSTKNLKSKVDSVFASLLLHLRELRGELSSEEDLWAVLELMRHSTNQHAVVSQQVKDAIKIAMDKDTLLHSSINRSFTLRLAAFQAFEAFVIANGQPVYAEADLWKQSLRYSIRSTDSKEYTSSLLQSLISYIDRLSISESNAALKSTENACVALPRTKSFCVDFLINGTIVQKGIYPGTTPEKEVFSLSLIENLLVYITQNGGFSSDNGVAKNSVILKRKRTDHEIVTMQNIFPALLSSEVFSALIALMHSIWDNTRSRSYVVFSKLLQAAEHAGFGIQPLVSSKSEHQSLFDRALFLASSPRQREADTGSRILSLLCFTHETHDDEEKYVNHILDLLDARVKSMRKKLSDILASKDGISAGKELPLAHGIIATMRLIVQEKTSRKKILSQNDGNWLNQGLYQAMSQLFIEAIQISLAVVADIKKGELIDGMDEENLIESEMSEQGDATPLNVNTGAIGANGTFSSVKQADTKQAEDRYSVQRVVIGSWLLTKETCAALSTVIGCEEFQPPFELVKKAGDLLISTLTTLKHAGAAFAARDSLQDIVSSCKKKGQYLCSLPEAFSERLLDEISVVDKVRDSTLRRSTGYALGFLSILRSENHSKSMQSKLCNNLINALVSLSLPATEDLQRSLKRLKLSDPDRTFISDRTSTLAKDCDADNDTKTRVHALNVLRLLILDAPLTEMLSPYIGDIVVSAILGYSNDSWAVRNSATMVFSAIMLRTIDADKNASNKDVTSSNAISITELFRRYPRLSGFLSAVTKASTSTNENRSRTFPILLLLSRVHSIYGSGSAAVTQIEVFIPEILRSLADEDFYVRAAAARALANLCSGDHHSISSSNSLLGWIQNVFNSADVTKDWNRIHGAGLLLKCLMESSCGSAANVYEMDLHKTIFSFCRRSNATAPLCLEPLVEVLYILAKNNATNGTERETHALLSECISQLTQIESADSSSTVFTLAFCQCKLLSGIIWKQDTTPSRLDIALTELYQLLTSDNIDIRLAASKAFKKEIYAGIDATIQIRLSDAKFLFQKIGVVFIRALETELLRGQDGTSDWPHPPFLRRISRCLLECLDGQNKSGDIRILFTDSEVSSQRFFKISKALLESDRAFFDTSFEPNGETFLSANTSELLAYYIGMFNCTERFENDSISYIKLLISRLNDDGLSWRCRYSAAVSIETSRLLDEDARTDADTKNILLTELRKMIQDFDPDVQTVSSRVLSRYAGISSDHTPECIVERAYSKTFPSHQMDSMLYDVLKSVLKYSEDLENAIKTLEDDMGEHVLNTSAKRKIFEAESLNPKEEPALICQLGIQTLLSADISPNPSNVGQCKELFCLASKVMDSCIAQRRHGSNMVIEFTRYPTIFVPLHSVLVATAVLRSKGFQDNDELYDKAKQILDSQDTGPFLHPEIVKVLQILAAPLDSLVASAFRDFFFLLR